MCSSKQIKELAERNAVYDFEKRAKMYGKEYIRYYYNKLAELNGRTISDIEPIKRQCVYEDNKPCSSSCRYSNTCIHSASKTEE